MTSELALRPTYPTWFVRLVCAIVCGPRATRRPPPDTVQGSLAPRGAA